LEVKKKNGIEKEQGTKLNEIVAEVWCERDDER
jgi:hypothetical protein